MQLQLQSLERQRQFGMISVLGCFSGHIPAALVQLRPNVSVTQSPNWGGFPEGECCNYLLDPNDPMFGTIAHLFMQAQKEVYGEDHWYNCDTFNEMDPASTDPSYLQSTSAAVINGIQSVDAQGKWLMQGWLFHSGFWTAQNVQAYLSGVSNDSMMILDLNSDAGPVFSEQTYFGKPFIWNMLHNYGGRRGVYGDIPTIASKPVADKRSYPAAMQGIGITPDALENTQIVYEMMLEMGWRSEAVSASEWVTQYVWRRYNCDVRECPLAHQAWQESLLPCAYTNMQSPALSLMQQHPSLTMDDYRWYNTTCVTAGWRLLYAAAMEMSMTKDVPGPMLYDLTDVCYQILGNLHWDLHAIMQSTYQRFQFVGDVDISRRLQALFSNLENLITVADELLSTNPNYMLGPWTASARAWGSDEKEKALLEFNAKNQVTLWGPTGQISDYACKSWAGLHKSYYLPRWQLFGEALYNCSLSYSQPERQCSGRFPEEYESDLLQLEQAWGEAATAFPTNPVGDNLEALARVDSYLSSTSALKDYQVLGDQDAPGNDLLVAWPDQTPYNTWTQDVLQLAWLCSVDNECLGFNSNGYLKNSTDVIMPAPGCTLYVKI